MRARSLYGEMSGESQPLGLAGGPPVASQLPRGPIQPMGFRPGSEVVNYIDILLAYKPFMNYIMGHTSLLPIYE